MSIIHVIYTDRYLLVILDNIAFMINTYHQPLDWQEEVKQCQEFFLQQCKKKHIFFVDNYFLIPYFTIKFHEKYILWNKFW